MEVTKTTKTVVLRCTCLEFNKITDKICIHYIFILYINDYIFRDSHHSLGHKIIFRFNSRKLKLHGIQCVITMNIVYIFPVRIKTLCFLFFYCVVDMVHTAQLLLLTFPSEYKTMKGRHGDHCQFKLTIYIVYVFVTPWQT